MLRLHMRVGSWIASHRIRGRRVFRVLNIPGSRGVFLRFQQSPSWYSEKFLFKSCLVPLGLGFRGFGVNTTKLGSWPAGTLGTCTICSMCCSTGTSTISSQRTRFFTTTGVEAAGYSQRQQKQEVRAGVPPRGSGGLARAASPWGRAPPAPAAAAINQTKTSKPNSAPENCSCLTAACDLWNAYRGSGKAGTVLLKPT